MQLSGLKYDAFKPELWAAELNFSLKRSHIGSNIVNTRYTGEIRRMGDTVHVQRPGAVTVRPYSGYTDITWEQPDPTDAVLLIDQGDYSAVEIDDIDAVQSKPDAMAANMREMAFSMNDELDRFIFTSFAAAASGIGDQANPVALTAYNIYDHMVDAGKNLDLANVPNEGRWFCVSPHETALLRKSPQFVPVGDGAGFAGGGTTASADTVRTGIIGRCANFAVLETNNLTTNSGVRKTMYGTNLAITLASQLTRLEAVRRESRFADGVKSLQVYGKKEFEPEALGVLHVDAS